MLANTLNFNHSIHIWNITRYESFTNNEQYNRLAKNGILYSIYLYLPTIKSLKFWQ